MPHLPEVAIMSLAIVTIVLGLWVQDLTRHLRHRERLIIELTRKDET